MKTKLTLNIDFVVIAKAKKKAEVKSRSLTEIVEEYLDQFKNEIIIKKK